MPSNLVRLTLSGAKSRKTIAQGMVLERGRNYEMPSEAFRLKFTTAEIKAMHTDPEVVVEEYDDFGGFAVCPDAERADPIEASPFRVLPVVSIERK